MGEKYEITAVKFEKAPSRKAACQMLKEIGKKPISILPRMVNKPLILYGAGNLGKLAREYFEGLGIPFLFVVDANPAQYGQDKFWSGVNILGIHDVPIQIKESSLLAVCVVLAPFTQVAAQLMKQGWSDIVPFYDIAEAYHDCHPLSNGWFSGVLDEQDICQIGSVLCRWEDDISRAHHLKFVAWRSLREEWVFNDAPIITNDRYFIPQVLSLLHDHEVFVDIGAHQGEVSFKFMNIIQNQYKEIYSIEPDEENFYLLKKNLQEYLPVDNGKLHLLKYAIGSVAEEKRFYNGLDYVSQFSDLGQAVIEVKCLDDLCIPSTFIKIHIEGWEGDAFHGGLDTIKLNRPILAITSYHNREGLWILPNQIMNCLENYIFYFRLHSWHGTGGVIYAIPKERLNQKVAYYG
jgi:FkbM family methyltransferase